MNEPNEGGANGFEFHNGLVKNQSGHRSENQAEEDFCVQFHGNGFFKKIIEEQKKKCVAQKLKRDKSGAAKGFYR